MQITAIGAPCTEHVLSSWQFFAQIPPAQILHTETLTNFSVPGDEYCADEFCFPAGFCGKDIKALALHAQPQGDPAKPDLIKLWQCPPKGLKCRDNIWCLCITNFCESDTCCVKPQMPALEENACQRMARLGVALRQWEECAVTGSVNAKGTSVNFKGVSYEQLQAQYQAAKAECHRCTCQRESRTVNIRLGCTR